MAQVLAKFLDGRFGPSARGAVQASELNWSIRVSPGPACPMSVKSSRPAWGATDGGQWGRALAETLGLMWRWPRESHVRCA